MRSRRSSRKALLPRSWTAAALVLAAALACLAAGCRRGANEARAPGPDYDAGAADAARLPDFDIRESEPEVAKSGVPHERYRVTLGDAPLRGPASAAVTIVMFSDFECPYCQRAHEITQQLEAEYAGQIRMAYKAFPLDFHGNAMVAAMAARTAQNAGKFWQFHDLLFSQQGLEQSRLESYARRVGIDVERLRRDLDKLEYGPEVRRDMRQGRKLGVSSTPTFFINGRELRGAKPIDVFRELIDEEISLAQTWLTQQVPPEKLYEHAIAEGYREVRYTERRRGLDPDAVLPVPLEDSPASGPATAEVTIVIFADFECPFCARGQETVDKILARYKGRIRLVFKHNPLAFHSHAFLAARASMAAHAQGKFWAYHDALYETKAKFDEQDLYRIARRVRLDMGRFRSAMGSTRFDALIARDQQLALLLGANGTPAYFINGRPIEGAAPELQFRLIIEEELERARRLLDEGIAPANLYDALVSRDLEDTP
jgi:protein-disulfide isomerase